MASDPLLYTIPAGYPFLESLAGGLLLQTQNDPLRLSQMEIFLPSRRACFELNRAFVRQNGGRPLLLPKLHPLGDIEEDEELLQSPQEEASLPPLIAPLERLGLLAKLTQDYTTKADLPSSPLLSFKLAKSLVKLMDQAAIENIPWEGLKNLVPSEFAGHWQLTLDFLEIIIQHWPLILKEKGVIEPYVRHHLLVDLILTRFKESPPSHPIIAAGSTGTMPATTRLLQAIARLPQGMVILPGLDQSLPTEDIQGLSPCHPQYALNSFLQKEGKIPQEIPSWPGLDETIPHPRAHLLSKALRTTFTFDGAEKPSEEALKDIYHLFCASPQEEALAISVLLRQQLETPLQRIALVTADLRLVERVKTELKRWGIEIDSSFGDPLSQTSAGIFLKLCAEWAANRDDPIKLLALLKHPLTYGGKTKETLEGELTRIEKEILRTPHKIKKTSGILKDLPSIPEDLCPLSLVQAHLKMAESLSTDENHVCHLWEGEEGAALKTFFTQVEAAASSFPSLSLDSYGEVLEELMKGTTLRSASPKHPRLAILGPIEARLFHGDVMILGGLNEGTWPPEATLDPWLNRPMRQELGFPTPERRIGLSAHDFSQAFTRPKVYLTRAVKIDGTPTLACRWLESLEIYLKGWNLTLPEAPQILGWVNQMDKPNAYVPSPLPLPTPPPSARPRRLSVTQIETWMRDPYSLYARMILSLTPLSPLKIAMTAAEKGTLAHAVLDKFFKLGGDPFSKKALDILLFIGETLFEPYHQDPFFSVFWRPRFQAFSEWFIQIERDTRLPGTKTFTEIKGKLTFSTVCGPFECTAKADRIDLLPDGRLRIIDYKTGLIPSDHDVALGFSPQLPLEGAIAINEGFEGLSANRLESLQFWSIKGGLQGGAIHTLPGDPHDMAQKALEGLAKMVALFDNESIPYPARPLLSKALRYNDYAHLARLAMTL